MTGITRVFASIFLIFVFLPGRITAQENDPWLRAKQIIDSVGTIVFLEKNFNVIDFGASI